jgi:uncharacterized protein (TIGR02588 family)
MSLTHQTNRNTKNPLEWIVFGLSCLLVAAAVGILLMDSIRQNDEPSILRAKAGEATRKGGLMIIPVTLTNSGAKTAADVRIEVEAVFPSGRKTTELAFDFVPRGGSREGFVVFAGEEKPSAVMPRVAGYVAP